MVSLGEVYNNLNLVNKNMEQMHCDIINLISAIDVLKTSVDETNNILNAGFKNMSCGIQNIITHQNLADQALFHLSEENQAIICVLEKISNQTCKMLSEVHVQAGSQKSIKENIGTVLELYKSAHPDVSLEAELFERCPREETEPLCTYKPCEVPKKLDEPPRTKYEVFKSVSNVNIG